MSAEELAAAPELDLLLGGLTGMQSAVDSLAQELAALRHDAVLQAPGAVQPLLLTPKYGTAFKVWMVLW